MVKELLIESYRTVKKMSGIDPSKPGSSRALVTNDSAWNTYVEALAESFTNKQDKAIFKMLAENTRVSLLESSISTFGINPYEAFALPILRVFYPKLVAKEAITLSPMDKPETVKAFIRATFSTSNSSTQYDAPVIDRDVSAGVQIGTPIAATITVPSSGYNILTTQSLTSEQAHLERDFNITAVSDGTTWVNVDIVPAVEGHFSGSVSTPMGDDVVSGYVDYLNGTVSISRANGCVVSVRYQVTLSLEENRINPKVNLTVDKIRLYARDRQIQANWSIHMEQDMRALFDVSIQAELVNILGQQIAADIDREIISALIVANSRLNADSHTLTFDRNPPATFTWGEKMWHENLIPVLNRASAQVYKDTHMDEANTILANPMDAALLEDLNGFAYTGTASLDGDVGYRSATVQGGKWKILSSALVPESTMILIFKPADELKSVFIYAPYVPAILTPYPLTYTPSLTILSRYSTAFTRSNGIAVVNITANN